MKYFLLSIVLLSGCSLGEEVKINIILECFDGADQLIQHEEVEVSHLTFTKDSHFDHCTFKRKFNK